MAALLTCLLLPLGVLSAQEERPQITPGERKAPRKKDAGPRAIGVLQMAANGKTSLVPVAILVGGKFWDATAYKADPIPMALETGTVYEAERAGSSLGLFTVSSALHSNGANMLSPWIGTGKWVPAGSEPTSKALKAETAPKGLDTTEGPPRLTRDPAKQAPTQNAPASTAPQSQPTDSSDSGDGPPRLKKSTPPSSDPPASSTPAGQTQPASGSPTPPAPADSKPSGAKPDNRANVPASDSGAGAENRPTLRRGKPVEPLPEDEMPGYSKPGTAPTAKTAAATADAAKATSAAADQSPIDMVPAISDAGGPEPHSFAFEWLKDEEGERRAQMVTLAKDQVRAYVEAQAKARITPKPAGTPAARRAPVAKTKDPILENVQMKSFDLWTNNQPVMVFSADAHMPPPPPGAAFSAVDTEMQYSVVLVAYPDIYNNIHKIYAGVTDKFHLDLTPRLELIDAVDADGDRRGELLFREISDGSKGWVIYRATTDKLWKMFDSLHPE